jgi:nitrite reductase/ring-hydroxylating ferredoxin subunit
LIVFRGGDPVQLMIYKVVAAPSITIPKTPTDALPTRRRVLSLFVGAAACGAAVAVGGGVSACSSSDGPYAAGNVSKFATGYVGFPGNGPYVLGRDTGGLYALSSICPHEDVDMSGNGSASASGIRCGKHNAAFSITGALVKGPAAEGLKHYRVDLAADGTVTVQVGTIVDAGVRTAVPS